MNQEMEVRHVIFREMLKAEREAGFQAGLQKGEQKSLVETYQEFGKNPKETMEKLMEKFQLSVEEAKEVVEKYWKE